jgi:AcrR family transcriptional regulator
VVEVASKCFSANTYGASSVREIASAADVSPSAIYYRFHDKVGLLAAVAEPLLSDLETLLPDTSTSVGSIDRVEVMRGYILAILHHRECAQVLLFDPSAGGTAPVERLADQQRRMIALLVGPRGTIDRQVRTRCAVAIAQLSAGELKGVPGHRLRKPLWEAAIDVLLGTAQPRIHVSEMGDATLDVRSPGSDRPISAGRVLEQEP